MAHRYRRTTKLRKEHADLISEWQEAVAKEQDIREKVRRHTLLALRSSPPRGIKHP
jgi:hypothetical protein